VEVLYQLESSVLTRLGLAREEKGKERVTTVPKDLRVQLSTKSIAGDKYLRLDFFDPRRSPLPELPFNPGPNYIPATPSTLKNLEESVMGALERVPELVMDVKTILLQTNGILSDLHDKQLPKRAAALLGRTEQLVVTMDQAVRDLHTGDFSAQTQATLANLDDTMFALRRLMERAQKQGGVIEGLERASFAMGDLAQRASPAGSELEDTLRSLRDMADTVQRLADALERDSDMLLKGRAKERER
jgi:paraquat-inducible protein B